MGFTRFLVGHPGVHSTTTNVRKQALAHTAAGAITLKVARMQQEKPYRNKSNRHALTRP